MEQLITITTLAQLEELEDYLKDKDYVAYDTETTGVEKESEIIGLSISADVSIGYYVIISYWDVAQGKLVYLETREGIKKFLFNLKSKNLIMHNAVFDCWMTDNNYQIDLMPSVHTDTLMLAHLLDENRSNGLKELAVAIYGEDSKKEQDEMKASVSKNGGMLTKANYELYKADAEIIARYGAKDAILTIKLFYELIGQLYDQKLDKFFYEDETMPLLRGPTYDLNTTGLRVDPEALSKLKATLEADCLEAKAFILKEISESIQEKYSGSSAKTTFNIDAGQQLSWLLFVKLNNEFSLLTKEGKAVCENLGLRLPYTLKDKRAFVSACIANKGRVYQKEAYNYKTKKMSRPKKVGDVWKYLACGKETLGKLAPKYKWVQTLLEYKKNKKLLNTYVEGIQKRMKYNVIRPNFLQHGTTSGRYSCKNPNFQNLPRDDKRVKGCIIPRPGNVFVGADHSQLEPRIFASHSKDVRLLECFKKKLDFYSVVGTEVFEIYDASLDKTDKKNFFRTKYEKEGQQSKVISLALPYGRTVNQLASSLGVTKERAAEIIKSYWEKWPSVKEMQLRAHNSAKSHGVVYNMFGRPRRIPKAMEIVKIYGNTKHEDLPYEARTLLNLGVNHEIQSSAASAMNRNSIAVTKKREELKKKDARWNEVKIVMQVHDELTLEGPIPLADEMAAVLKDAMENSVRLPGVDLIAEPKIAYNLADLK